LVQKLYWTDLGFISRRQIVKRSAFRREGRQDELLRRYRRAIEALEGAKGKGPARGRRRQALLRRARSIDRQFGGFMGESLASATDSDWLIEPGQLLDAVRAELGRRRKAKRRKDKLGTDAALMAGEAAPEPPMDARFNNFRALIRGAAGPAALACATRPQMAPVSVGVLEDHPRIDMRVLARRFKISPGGIYVGRLRWLTEGRRGPQAEVLINLSDEAHPFLAIMLSTEAAQPIQIIGLRKGPSAVYKRWYLECPVTGEPTEVLALRHGVFASRKAHRLVNQSQRPKRRRSTSALQEAGAVDAPMATPAESPTAVPALTVDGPGSIDHWPSITIRELRARGLLRPGVGCSYEFSWRDRPLLLDPIEVKVEWQPDWKRVSLTYNSLAGWGLDQFYIFRHHNGLVEHLYFICPETGKKCTSIYFDDFSFGSRHAKQLRYPSQSRKPSPVAPGLAPLVGPRRRGPMRKKREAASDRAEGSGMDATSAALKEGSAYTRDITFPWFDDDFQSLRTNAEALAETRSLPEALSLAFWEDHQRLDVRVLAREGLLREGERTGAVLLWPPGSLLEGMNLVCDLRKRDAPGLFLQCFVEGEASHQYIRLTRVVRKGHPRYLMICAATWRRVEVMAFRGGRFASKGAQRLINASQRSARPAVTDCEARSADLPSPEGFQPQGVA
jgi:hypothetical protein